MGEGLVVVRRLSVASGLAPRWGAKRPLVQAIKILLKHHRVWNGAASRPSASKLAHHRVVCTPVTRVLFGIWRQILGFVANFAPINAGIVVKGCDAME